MNKVRAWQTNELMTNNSQRVARSKSYLFDSELHYH